MNQPLPERIRDVLLVYIARRRAGEILIDPDDVKFNVSERAFQWAREWWLQEGVVTCFSGTRVGERNWSSSIIAPLFGVRHGGWVAAIDEPFGFLNRRKLLAGRHNGSV